MKTIYQKHPSSLLNALYQKKNYQGANPKDADIIILGRDANWAFDIEQTDFFKSVEEYLIDGVSFWHRHNIHHPFLLPNYKGDGKRYHKTFSKLQLKSSASDKISFVELIGFPTTGMAKTANHTFRNYLISDLNKNHLKELDKTLNDRRKTIFIAWGLTEDFKFINKHTGLFERFASLDKSYMSISDLNQFENIYIHKHFSDSISNETIFKMANRIIHHLKLSQNKPFNEETYSYINQIIPLPKNENYSIKIMNRNSAEVTTTYLGRDKTKYIFQNKVLGKARLVFEIVKHYIKENQHLTYQELLDKFPKKLQGSVGVINTVDFVNQKYSESKNKRHFNEKNETLMSADGIQFLVSTQWGISNINNILELANKEKYDIQEKNCW